MTAGFAPSLGGLASAIAGRPLPELWLEPAELARAALEARERTGATHVLFPFDDLVLAEAAGVKLLWSQAAPKMHPHSQIELGDADPSVLLARGRVPSAVATNRFIASQVPVIANVPSPRLLLRQLGQDEAAEDALLDCADACAAFSRALLEGGASVVIVSTVDGDDGELTPVKRLAELFDAPLMLRSDPSVVTLDISAFLRGGGLPTRAVDAGSQIVLVSHPLPGDVDLGRVAQAARAVKGT